MKKTDPPIPRADPAAVFAGALSIWEACSKREVQDPRADLSEIFNGIDELMRVAMKAATLFEDWACQHVEFDRLLDCWPYKLQLEMGEACLSFLSLDQLPGFNDEHALRLAIKLQLPLAPSARKLIPLRIHATNPIPQARFQTVYIQTVREAKDGSGIYPFTEEDDLADPCFGSLFYGVYGRDAEGTSEHIADRRTPEAAIQVATGLIPGLLFGR